MWDFSRAGNVTTQKLGISSDPNVPRFDWKAGTSVRAALDQIMSEMGYRYTVCHGTLNLIECNEDTGLPVVPGREWNSGGADYPFTKIPTVDRQPDFDNIRNQIILTAMEQVDGGQGTNFVDVPLKPLIASVQIHTTPEFPWAKMIVEGETGTMTQAQLVALVAKRSRLWRTYNIAGKTTIPGNAEILPFDLWNGYYISSVTQNIDLQNKTWTTDIELFYYG